MVGMQLLVASTVTLPNILPIVHVHLFHKVHNIKTQGNHNDFTNVVVHILLTPVNCALFCWKIRVHNISIYAHCNFNKSRYFNEIRNNYGFGKHLIIMVYQNATVGDIKYVVLILYHSLGN